MKAKEGSVFFLRIFIIDNRAERLENDTCDFRERERATRNNECASCSHSIDCFSHYGHQNSNCKSILSHKLQTNSFPNKLNGQLS